jgi:hypothetical protein
MPLPFNGGSISKEISVSFACLICSLTVINESCKANDANALVKARLNEFIKKTILMAKLIFVLHAPKHQYKEPR